MSVLEWQADRVLPTSWLRYIGAVRTYGARINFFLSVPNTLMIGALFYNDSASLQSIFPTLWTWMAFLLFVVVPAGIFIDRVLLHPAQVTYNAHQAGRENRSPNYRETMENQRRIEDLHEKVDDLGRREND